MAPLFIFTSMSYDVLLAYVRWTCCLNLLAVLRLLCHIYRQLPTKHLDQESHRRWPSEDDRVNHY